MKINVKLFAAAAQLACARSVDIEIDESATVADLRRQLAERYDALAPLIQHAMVAVNQQYAGDTARIDADAEVALIPPVSGG